MKHTIKLLFLMLLASSVQAEIFEVSQFKKAFSIKAITIKVGDRIEFPNKDPFFHNVYSLSAIKSFELGSYPPGESKGIDFDKAGEVEVNCAIHPNMVLMVTVEP